MTDTENQMNAVERMYEYRDGIQLEAAAVVEDNRPDAAWPQNGAIEVEGLSMRYREGLRLVLEDVSSPTFFSRCRPVRRSASTLVRTALSISKGSQTNVGFSHASTFCVAWLVLCVRRRSPGALSSPELGHSISFSL